MSTEPEALLVVPECGGLPVVVEGVEVHVQQLVRLAQPIPTHKHTSFHTHSSTQACISQALPLVVLCV